MRHHSRELTVLACVARAQEIAGALSDPVTAGTLQLVPAAERDGASPALGMQVAFKHSPC